MEFVSPIISPVVQSLMVPVKKHLGFLVSSTKHVKDMEARMKQLIDTAEEVQATWDNAVVNTEVVPKHVEPWLKDVKTLNEKSNLIEAIGCFNMAKRYKVGKQSYGIIKEIEDLENQKSKIVFSHEQKSLAELGSTSAGPSTSALVPMSTQNIFMSRDSIFNDALQALQSNDESQKMIALWGMGGVGKTTMMLQLKKAVEASKAFDWVVKVVIGEKPNTIYVQQAIAEYIGKDLKETDKDSRADRLRKIFEEKSQQSQKKNLVIMDDLWNKIDLTDVGLSPLPNGFKLLYTSRFEKLCIEMGVDSIFKIEVLSKTEAKSLFSNTVRPSPSDGDDAELQMIGEDIVMKCGGLPIAIVTIAKFLSGNTKDAWKETLYNLQHNDLQDIDDIVPKVFEMSYNNLKKEDEKAIFLLCGLFPDDFNIPIEDLMRYGWGLKLFTKVHTLSQARLRTNNCVNNLIGANLLTKSDGIGCVKMHDLVRAFVLSNFSKVKQASIVSHDSMSMHTLTKDANESYERILLKCTGMCEFPTDFNYPNLSLLILMDGNKLKFPEDIYERMKNVKVMSFQELSIPLLPVRLEHSTQLRTLCLHSCLLINKDISFLGSLCNLELLSFVNCELKWLPQTIGQLKKLKLLELTERGTGNVELSIDDGVFQNLGSLEELYVRSSTITKGNLHELEKLSQGLFALELDFFENKVQPKNVSFKSLERFSISIGKSLKYDEENSLKNTLDLDTDLNELLECKINELFEKVDKLWLKVRGMNHLQDVSLHHKFFNLRDLHVSHCSDLTYLFTIDVASSLKKLERLRISECNALTSLVGGEDSGVIRFPKLNFLYLEHLPNMACLSENVIQLPGMVELMLIDLPNFTSIYPESNNDTHERQSLLNRKVVIPKLENLRIYSMKNLKQIWPCRISTTEKNSVSMLRNITVEHCDSLMNLFPCNPLPLLNHLEKLYLRDCDSIEVLFNIDFESVSGMGEDNNNSSRLKSIDVTYLRELKELWRLRGVNNSGILINGGFKGVEILKIHNCWRFTNIFTPATTNFEVRSLCISYDGEYYTHEWYKTHQMHMIESDDEDAPLVDYELKSELAERYKSELMKSYQEIVAYPSYLDSYDLQRLELRYDARVNGVLFEMDSPLFLYGLPTIQVLELSNMDMTHVWKCNWNKLLIPQHQPLQYPLQNLTKISLWKCHKIKYLFSPLMVKFLSNLKHVFIYYCDGFEEVISSRDDEDEENTSSTSASLQNTIFFPCLGTLKLHFLDGLKGIDSIHGHIQSAQITSACWSLCQYPRHISIESCHELSSLVPWYAVGQMKELLELEIRNCKRMVEVFESGLINYSSNNEGSERNGAGTSTTTSTTLQNITTVAVPQLSNLKSVLIYDCDLLPHIFTFSTLESLKQLKELRVMQCKAIRVIVKEEDGTQSKGVVFPRLETLELEHLPDLKGFFLGMNDFRWPLLANVVIKNCPQMMVFTSGQSTYPKLKYIQTSLGKHTLECDLKSCGTINQYQVTFPTSSNPTISKGVPWSFHNLIEMKIRGNTNVERIIPSHALLQLQMLQHISIDGCDEVKEVFEVALEGTNNNGFNESQAVVKIPSLTQVELWSLMSLKSLWKSNQWMVLEFPNLTILSINHCNSLEHVFTCSMVGSLVQLQGLRITYCMNIEVIVKEEEEKECDGKVNEFMLPRLKSLKLYELRSLKGFCLGEDVFSLPALDTLEIGNCPIFPNGHLFTHELKVIDTTSRMCDVRTDFKYLWKNCHWMVPNLTAVFIEYCDSLEHVFTCSMVGSLVQLQDLTVRCCDNIEVIVKEEEESDGEVNEIMFPRLKSLTLFKLPRLKGFCVGKEAFSLPALDTLEIKECRAITVFTKGDLSTPVLKVTDIGSRMYAVRGDLNSVIETNQREDASS